MAMDSQKAITLGFLVHGQCSWYFIAGSSLGGWGTVDSYIASHY